MSNEEYWVDGSNRWSKDKYTEEGFLRVRETLINCIGCVDCESCYKCEECTDCKNCNNCLHRM